MMGGFKEFVEGRCIGLESSEQYCDVETVGL